MAAPALASRSAAEAPNGYARPASDGRGDAVDRPLRPELLQRLAHAMVARPDAPRRTSYAPLTGHALVDLPQSDATDVEHAFAASRRAQRSWAATPVRRRSAILLAFHDLVLSHRDEGLDVVQWETGKARRDALEELLDVCLTTRHYARDAERLLRPRRHRGAIPLVVGATEVAHPKGVVGVITPWNYPLTLAVSDAVPALLAGNGVVLLPDVQTSLSALWVIDLLHRAGLPEGLFGVVLGPGADLGPEVIARSDYVMFTGSTAVGRQIAAQCGERLIGCSLELGGKNPMIVRADADLDAAASLAVRACFANAGQLCVSIERIYVHADVHDEFLRRLVQRTCEVRLAAHVGWGADMGSLISQRQLGRVTEQVAEARRLGATVHTGGEARPEIGPFFYEPTVLTGVTDDMRVHGEETFGPVVSVYAVADDDEAVRLANDSPYGLNASILTRDRAAGAEMARRLHTGTVNINEGYAASWASVRAPMGGMGDSGLGRRHGADGLLKYTEPQTIAVQRILSFEPAFGWDDQRWGGLLTQAVATMKKLGLK